MDKYKETFETWNKVASIYEEKFMDLDLYNETYDFVCNSLPQHAKILELGCGPGNITKYLLTTRPDLDILGTDIAPNMIELARKNNQTAHFRIMDSRNINKLQTKFDAIICGFIIPYLSPLDYKKLMAHAFQLLNDQGLIYISFVEGNPEESGFQTGSTGDRSYFYYYSLNEIKKLLPNQGFEEITVFEVDYKKSATEKDIHTVLIARKNS
jgi:trans-aconitate methyltransferase